MKLADLDAFNKMLDELDKKEKAKKRIL